MRTAPHLPTPHCHRPQAMPYELRALEAALMTVVKILDQEVATLEAMTFPGAERSR